MTQYPIKCFLLVGYGRNQNFGKSFMYLTMTIKFIRQKLPHNFLKKYGSSGDKSM